MFVLPRRNVILRGAADETFVLKKDVMTSVPDRFSGTEYFQALVKDGLIVAVESTKDRIVEPAIEKAEAKEKAARKRAKKAAEE